MSAYEPWEFITPINSKELPFGESGITFPFYNDYEWIFILAIIIGFYAACGIGANDCANSFATSVGSGSLKLWHAVIIAGIFEFLGAILLGAAVTDTIRGKLVNTKDFSGQEDLLMVGMFIALIGTSTWLTIATIKEMPVSTTHSIVGAVLGFSLCTPGLTIAWKEIGKIVGSWFLSPCLSGVMSAIFFFTIRSTILRSENSFNRTLIFFPIIVWFVVTINIWFIIIKGGKPYKWSESLGGDWASLGVSAAVSLGVALILQFTLVPLMRRKLQNLTEKSAENEQNSSEAESDGVEVEVDGNDYAIEDAKKSLPANSSVQQATTVQQSKAEKSAGIAGWANRKDAELREIRNERVAEIHDNAEKFEYRTELAFGYLQVFTACMMAFAHGANDVANAIGPLASIVSIYHNNGISSSKSPVPKWILVLGGAGIVVGLTVYGHKVIRALGVKLIKVTPSRGSCIELATAFVIVIGSILGLPLSTTHTMVGASIGVGVLEGARKSINLKLLSKIFFGWIITLVVAGGASAAVYSFVVYAPSVNRPLAPQNCMSEYGKLFANTTNLSLQAGSTVLVGESSGDFVVIQ